MKRAFLIRGGLIVWAAGAGWSPPAEAQNRDRNVITQEELERVAQRSPNLYQAVRSLRQHMVDTTRGANRGVRSLDVGAPGRSDAGREATVGTTRNTPVPRPILYVDNRRLGDFLLMQDIPTLEVAEVRFLDRTRAANDLGIGHEGGAIMVTMRKPKEP